MYAEFIIIISIRICTSSENRWIVPYRTVVCTVYELYIYFLQLDTTTTNHDPYPDCTHKREIRESLGCCTKSRFLDDATELLAFRERGILKDRPR